jgi:hypothetical protein
MTRGIQGDNPYRQIKEIMVGSGSEASRIERSTKILNDALAAVAQATTPQDAAQLGFSKLREEGVPVSHALQIAGQAFDIAPHQVRQRIAQLGDEILRHVQGDQIRNMSTKYGAVTLMQEDLTNPATPVDITVVAMKPWAGNKGGQVGSWLQYAQGAGEIGRAIEKAVQTYDDFAERSPGKKLPPGYTLPVPTGLEPNAGPSIMLFANTIPADEGNIGNRTKENRDDRMANLRDKMQRILIQLQQIALMNPALAGKDKIRVSLGFLGTGSLGMVDTQECAAVMKELIEKFQQQNPQFEFIFKTTNVKKEPDYADQVNGFFNVFTGKQTDIALPRLQDARELLTAALHPFQTPRKDGSTLDSAAVGRELDANNKTGWAAKFLAALDKLPADALADRAAGRAYFVGNDRETFSMLHKLAELGAFDNVQRKTVTKADIEKLLANPRIRENVEQLLSDQLPNVFSRPSKELPNAFGGAGSMGEIMSAAVGSYLLTTLQKNHREIETKIDRELDQSQAAIVELARQLGLEQKQVESLRSESRDLKTEIAGLKRSLSGKETTIDDLERELSRERRAHETRRTYATSYPSGSTGC